MDTASAWYRQVIPLSSTQHVSQASEKSKRSSQNNVLVFSEIEIARKAPVAPRLMPNELYLHIVK